MKNNALGRERLTPGKVQKTGKAQGLLIVYRYRGRQRIEHQFHTWKRGGDGVKLARLEHLPLYDLAVDPDSEKAADWAESVPQYVVPAPAAEAE